MDDQPLNPVQEEDLAIARIAASADGFLLHRRLRRVLEGVVETDDPGALQRQTGRRTLARDLMLIMAEAIEAKSAGRDHTGSEPVLVRGAPARAYSRRGPGRRVTADSTVPGWNDLPDDDAA